MNNSFLAFLADNVGMWECFFFCAKPLLEKIPGGEGTAVYGLYRYVPLWRVWFSGSLLLGRVYNLERLGLEEGIIFQETDQLVEDFI